ncbi:Crp/Fnr family transcriptional regulator [Paenibacillus durus]|uniref:Cyclic nucleotide-binding domain-containing protein n=1 Tax=Paenibacillus durus ATCC 35681 TaxID=1333534 RepID=A0A0F7CGK9_PAEDU|nr:cyclic nucleotide-binding domain-containing protein [Paenibacillus durus]AKG33601.1 hypothetical protein VK70_02535 [Paenibacillus durus ATCC 35681]
MRIETSKKLIQEYLQHFQIEDMFPQSVLTHLELHFYEAREYVTIVDESPEFFRICMDGKMKIIPSSEEGRVVLLDYLYPLSLIGDIELFCHCKNLHSVMAVTPTVTLSIPKQIFYKEMMRDQFLLFLCENLSKKLYVSSMNYSRAMLYSVKSRFCHYILQLSDEIEYNTISLKIGETAQYLGITERHLHRIIKEYEKKGIIKQIYQRVSILNRNLLEIESSYK